MTRDEMAKTIEQAMRSYSWDNRVTTLPNYLANAIAGAQPKETWTLQNKLDKAEATIAAIKEAMKCAN